jgi:hypothetical protein
MASTITPDAANGRKELLMLIFVMFAGVNLVINLIRPMGRPERS